MSFATRLLVGIQQKKTPLMVGLDPRRESLPASFQDLIDAAVLRGVDHWQATAVAFEKFCCEVIDVVAAQVAVVKPQLAFFEECGPAGMTALHKVIGHARAAGLVVVLDGKRNDIGSTGQAYAAAYLGRPPLSPWGGDALTVNPWMGFDTLKPFVDLAKDRNAGIFVLTKTSNPGSRDLQEQVSEQGLLYRQVAGEVERYAAATADSSSYGIVGAVVGATFPQQLAELRAAMPHTWFLVPGFGAQGGSARDVAGSFDQRGLGALINSSRAIIFAHELPAYRDEARWERAVERATRDAIQQLADETPAGRLQDGN